MAMCSCSCMADESMRLGGCLGGGELNKKHAYVWECSVELIVSVTVQA
jgi:hypothetical protein